ncbi:MAG: MarR family transcriptional regulator [Actinomycetia bacterium]|nr:MarR family transcriptional regulator [Actinomycetes bacterium]MCP3911490.1 MarR family transcriptional regulator [Actinomycetes bacterium]MCP4088142.1 MarR family transcriptional regulator [Actinomycetes bacterium]
MATERPGAETTPEQHTRANGARAAVRLARIVELALVEVGLSPAQYRMLIFLADGVAPASALATKLRVSRPSITALVDGLAEKGLVVRQDDPTDRRKVDLVLTPEGGEALSRADAQVAASLDDLFDELDEGDDAPAWAGLGLILESLNRKRRAALEGT